jgi:hypothetical protein
MRVTKPNHGPRVTLCTVLESPNLRVAAQLCVVTKPKDLPLVALITRDVESAGCHCANPARSGNTERNVR